MFEQITAASSRVVESGDDAAPPAAAGVLVRSGAVCKIGVLVLGLPDAR